ncbi:MAG TPA: hypothetical protein VND92_11015 [Vicinamibacterales bacterium]|nr:hypothetical protein [Vicinamibacterales bacterium]
MDPLEFPEPARPLSRRRILQMLAALGIAGPAAARLSAQAHAQLSVDTLRCADAIIDQKFAEDRLPIIERALQRNLDQFQIVRDLQIDDLIEPAPIFLARGR